MNALAFEKTILMISRREDPSLDERRVKDWWRSIMGLKCYPNFGWGRVEMWRGGEEGFAGAPHKEARNPSERCSKKLHGSRSAGFT
jgi:hypothetical protein